MKKTCVQCGREFDGHHNRKVCGAECHLWWRRQYGRAYWREHVRVVKEPEAIAPFPEYIDREAFGHWLSGFTDGEATFGMTAATLKSKGKSKDRFVAFFRIALRDDETATLRLVQSYLGCGTIYFCDNARSKIANAKPIAAFSVQRTGDLFGKIIPHFERFPLRAKKRHDFAIWRQGVELMAEIQGRPAVPNYGKGGLLPRWTDQDKERFLALALELTAQRRYDNAAGPAT